MFSMTNVKQTYMQFPALNLLFDLKKSGMLDLERWLNQVSGYKWWCKENLCSSQKTKMLMLEIQNKNQMLEIQNNSLCISGKRNKASNREHWLCFSSSRYRVICWVYPAFSFFNLYSLWCRKGIHPCKWGNMKLTQDEDDQTEMASKNMGNRQWKIPPPTVFPQRLASKAYFPYLKQSV